MSCLDSMILEALVIVYPPINGEKKFLLRSIGSVMRRGMVVYSCMYFSKWPQFLHSSARKVIVDGHSYTNAGNGNVFGYKLKAESKNVNLFRPFYVAFPGVNTQKLSPLVLHCILLLYR